MNEAAITAAIQRYLKTVPECFYFKEHGGQVRPDRALCKVV